MTTKLREVDGDICATQELHPQTGISVDEHMSNHSNQIYHGNDEMEVDMPAHPSNNQNSQGETTQAGTPDDLSHDEVDPFLAYSDERPQYDPDSLFIPERDPTPPKSLPQPPAEDAISPTHASDPAPAPVPVPVPVQDPTPISATSPIAPLAPASVTPPASMPRPSLISASVLDRIRNMNKKHADKKQNRSQIQRPKINTNTHKQQCALDNEESANRKAEEEFQEKKSYFDGLREKHKGSLPFALDIEWIKIKSSEEARLKKRARDIAKAREGEDDNLGGFVALEPTQNSDEDMLSDTGGAQSRLGNSVSMQDVELESMRVALEAHKDDPSKKRKKKKKDKEPGTKAKPRPARKKKDPTAPKKITKRQSKKKQKDMDNAAKQARSLLYSNIFSQQAGPDAADQPFFTSSKTKEALKELIASVPREDEQQARSDISQLTKASRSFSRAAVKPDSKGSLWSVRGMKTSLKPYQLLGSAFMRNRENSTEEPRGGLLADQMGLGKTLMMLANIHDGLPPRNSTGPKTTLIVASPALLNQWKSEIEQHSSTKLSILRVRTETWADSSDVIRIMSGHDIVLATYSEVMKSYPRNNPPLSCDTDEQREQWWKERYEKERGALHRIHFLRVVLDEAQAIKNHLSLTSIACRGLIADHKWALSGTPILNGLGELYPYFKFIGVPRTGDYDSFKKYYCDPKNPERLLVRLSQFMLRRTHADHMFGAPILKLPQANQSTYWCHFNSVERCVYDIVHQRFIERIQSFMHAKTLNKSYNNILVMLLRLRQLATHILMLQFVARDLLEMRDIECIREVTERQAAISSTEGGKTIVAIRKQLEKLAEDEKKRKKELENSAANRDEAEDLGVDDIDDEEPETAHGYGAGGEFGKEYNFKPFLNSLKTGESWEKAKMEAKCGACGKRPTRPMITSCGHLICEEPCYQDACFESAESNKENPPCKTCGKTLQFVELCDADDWDTLDTPASGTRSNAKKNQENRLKRLYREDIQADWLASIGDDVLPSAKTIAVKSQIMNWLKEDPKVKIIVYTQFLAMVQILARVCQNEGWKVLQYHGKMSLQARENAIRAFNKDKDAKILLASLRCGGLGLNLTMASKVILIDPWWNSATEQQAFCRVFRIGQSQETYMSRLCVEATVDEKLMEMQERKEKEIQRVMKEGGKPVKGLTLRKLAELFGLFADEADDLDEVHDDEDVL